jgi:hypothetical protein
MAEKSDKQAAAPKNKAIRDSEGLPVVTTPKDETEEESLNEAAKEAFEEELTRGVSEDAARQAEENAKAFQEFLDKRA